MKRNRENEKKILYECLERDNKEPLVKEYGGLIYAVVQKTIVFSGIMLRYEDIEDLRVDVFIKLFSENCKKLRQFDHKKLSLAGWIKLIANQTTLDEIRKKDPHGLSKQRFTVLVDDVVELMSYNNEGLFDSIEKLRVVESVMNEMSEKDQNILKMFYFDELSISEVAKEIGKSSKTTQTAKDRARKKLTKKVEERLIV